MKHRGARRLLPALALLFCLSLPGCSGSPASSSAAVPEQPEPSPSPAAAAEPGVLTLGYLPAEGFNPYLVNSQLVMQNAGLLFEKLVEITPDMELDYRLAQAVECVGNQVVVHLRGGCFFADGTPVRPEDALASLAAARASACYGGRFANIEKAELQNGALVITLARPDSLFAYLCDIPVLKESEVSLARPTASGRYTYGAEAELVRNTRAAFPEEGPECIRLAQVSGYDAMVSGLAVGALNLYAAADGVDAVSSIASQQSFYRTNNLVYLGVNALREEPGAGAALLSTGRGRALLSRLVDRRVLAEKCFYGRAYPATGAINGFYTCVKGSQLILAEQDAAGAEEEFLALGYTRDPVSGYYQDAEGNPLRLSLLVYSGSTYRRYAASQLAEQLAAQGVYLEINDPDDFGAYLEQVQAGQFDLYIGEVKLYNNMDISPFLEGGAASVGIQPSETLTASYEAFCANLSAAGAFEEQFAAEMPWIPLLWRSGTVVSSRSVSGLSASISNLFYSLEGLVVAP